VLTFLSCGTCRPCRQGVLANCENFNALNFSGCRPDGSHAVEEQSGPVLGDRFFGQSSFATHAIAHERNVVKVRRDAPLELLGPLGCGIQTGAGAVFNALALQPGSSFAAFGGGAVGLSAVMAARVAGAVTIIAIDVVQARLDLALEIGATHVINPHENDVIDSIKAITNGGVDASLDSTGIATVIDQAVTSLRPRGSCAIVGAAPPGTRLDLDMMDVMQNCKSIRGVVEGNGNPDLMIPMLVDLFMSGRFPIDRLSTFYELGEINEAARDSETGGTIKPIIRMPQHL
jgi:aryl-alcohol dehydrogenase